MPDIEEMSKSLIWVEQREVAREGSLRSRPLCSISKDKQNEQDFPRSMECLEYMAQSQVWRNRKDTAGIQQVTEAWPCVPGFKVRL